MARPFLTITGMEMLIGDDLPPLSSLGGTLNLTQLDQTGVTGQVPCDIGASGLRWQHIQEVNLAPTFKSGSGVVPLATLSSLTTNDILKWDGTRWINTPIPAGAIASINGDTTAAQLIQGAGNMSVSTTGGVTTVIPSAQAGGAVYWMLPSQYTGSTTTASVGANDRVHVHRFYLPLRMTIAQVTFRIATGTAASNASVGIYSDDGNSKYVDTGPQASTGAATVRYTLGTPATIPPGYYWFALTCSSTTPTFLAMTNSTFFNTVLNDGTAQFGHAANTSTAGQLPATLGSITAEDRAAFVCKLQG